MNDAELAEFAERQQVYIERCADIVAHIEAGGYVEADVLYKLRDELLMSVEKLAEHMRKQ